MNEFSKVIDLLTPVVCSNVNRSMVLLWLDSDIYLALAKSVFKFLAFIYSTQFSNSLFLSIQLTEIRSIVWLVFYLFYL